MNKWTKEEISLCKQVAKKHRKKIGEGDWYSYDTKDLKNKIFLVNQDEYIKVKEQIGEDIFPLWTISDCLEWLKEKYNDVSIGSISGEWDIQIYDAYDKVHHLEFLEDIRGKTPLEACLKAVLAVLEEK